MGEPVRVLYVDDDTAFGDLVCYWLNEDEGEPPVSVETATGTEEALATLAAEPIDCVVSDYLMADRDGIELLEAIRERRVPVPFILFTAHGGAETARDAFRAGVADYMPKGGDRETIATLAERVRAAVRAHRESPEKSSVESPEKSSVESSVESVTPVGGKATPTGAADSQTAAEPTAGGPTPAHAELRYRAGLREVALDAATSLMSATPDELDAKIRFTLRSLCDQMDVRRAATYRRTDEKYECGHTIPDGSVPETLSAFAEPAWLDRLETFETVRYGPPGTHPTVETRTAPADRSGVAAPMIADWQLDGVVVFDAGPDRTWADEEVQLVETITTLITRALERRQQARELRRQNDRLDRFASVVSHDLRNPINVADGWLELAREGNEEAFDRVEHALARMEQLTEDVLTLARDGASVGKTEPVSVRSVARRAWERVDTADASVDLGSLGEVEADESRLASVFENLFRNAIEHGGSDVAVCVGPTDDGFYVADDGPGLPAEPESLFEWGETTAEDGSGLGLAIVARIAEGHGWEVTAEDDDGARFEFRVS